MVRCGVFGMFQLLKAVKRCLLSLLENCCLIVGLFGGYREGFCVFAKRRVSSPRGLRGMLLGRCVIVGLRSCVYQSLVGC
jgi:hypothetical protein